MKTATFLDRGRNPWSPSEYVPGTLCPINIAIPYQTAHEKCTFVFRLLQKCILTWYCEIKRFIVCVLRVAEARTWGYLVGTNMCLPSKSHGPVGQPLNPTQQFKNNSFSLENRRDFASEKKFRMIFDSKYSVLQWWTMIDQRARGNRRIQVENKNWPFCLV